MPFSVTGCDTLDTPSQVECPYRRIPVDAKQDRDESLWKVVLNRPQAYQRFEGHGLIVRGHTTFYDQHFAVTVSLPYLLRSSSALKAELIHRVETLIRDQKVDCILYPQNSSISLLVDALDRKSGNKLPKAVVCRQTAWPDGQRGYDIDHVGREFLKRAKNILILEDETYTGSSIKELAKLSFEIPEERPDKLLVFMVVDSMRRTERAVLARLLDEISRANESNRDLFTSQPVVIRVDAFARFSLRTYWSKTSCPLCRRISLFERQMSEMTGRIGYIERTYASERLKQLKPEPTEQAYQARRNLEPLEHPEVYDRPRSPLPVTIATLEGQWAYCEEAYVEGDLAWLIEKVSPGLLTLSDQGWLFAVEMLSSDFGLLFESNLREEFVKQVGLFLEKRYLHGPRLGRLMEILAEWPLYLLEVIWGELIDAVLGEPLAGFTACYGALHLLLLEMESRSPHPSKDRMRCLFIEKVESLNEEGSQDPYDRTKALLAKCLQHNLVYSDLGGLLEHAMSLTSYFVDADRENHWLLLYGLRDLRDLASCHEDRDVMHYFAVPQMLEQLEHVLASIGEQDPSFIHAVQAHPRYGEFKNLTSALLASFPREGCMGSQNVQIQQLAAELEELLYYADETDTLRSELTNYLSAYRVSLSDALEPITSTPKGQAPEIRFVDGQSPSNYPEVFLILNQGTIDAVFGELRKNMCKAMKSWMSEKAATATLYNYDEYIVVIGIECLTDRVRLEFRNPCTKEDFDHLKSGAGQGIHQIRAALGRLGHTYGEPKWDHEMLSQQLEIRRAYP